MHSSNFRLQPWRYLYETASQLNTLGYAVTVITDRRLTDQDHDLNPGFKINYLPSIHNPIFRKNSSLNRMIYKIDPDVVLWHIGLTSLLHEQWNIGKDIPIVGIFTSPIYQAGDFLRWGLKRAIKNYPATYMHFLPCLIPGLFFRLRVRHSRLHDLVVETETTRRQILKLGFWKKTIHVISPGVDGAWRKTKRKPDMFLPQEIGFDKKDLVVLYFGPPDQIRGLHTLLHAFNLAHQANPSLKLLILSRRRKGEQFPGEGEVSQLINKCGPTSVVCIEGFLEEKTIVNYAWACDLIALPFEWVPSDAPLTLLEAQALRKPIVTTDIACIPELVRNGPSYLARVADPASLARAILRAVDGLQSSRLGEVLRNRPFRTWRQVGREWSDLIQGL